MHLVIIQEKHFGPLEGYDNHECDWKIEDEEGVMVITWTCGKCPGFILKTYANDRPGIYRSGTKDPDIATKVHHYGKCEPTMN